ncbi:MAG: hypothetical protein RIB60_04195 [Phycisphaerales bacterium]
MPDLPVLAWIAISLISMGVCVAMLRALGSTAAAATESHDLRVEVMELHLEYKRRLMELNGGHEGTEDDPIEGVPLEELESEDVMPA